MAHPYDESRLPAVDSVMGKAFDIAERHLSGGMGKFYTLFCRSKLARTFDGPDADPAVGASGIQLVLDVCGEEDDSMGLETLLSREHRLPRDQMDCARWCGQSLARYQWQTGVSFRTIALAVTVEDLRDIFRKASGADPWTGAEMIAALTSRRRQPTRLRAFRAARGLTQATLAEQSGVSLRAIQQYEQRKKDINHAQAISVLQMARALGCTVEDLLEG